MPEFDFWIDGYRPQWHRDVSAVTAAHGRRLASLVGKTLTNSLLVWETAGNHWLCLCPVLLDFEGEQVEINFWRFDEVSITWNTIDPNKPVRSPDEKRSNVWRDDISDGLSALRGQTLKTVLLLERWESEVGIGLIFTDGQLTAYNAGDAVGLDFKVFDPQFRRYRLG
ncbi:hypothetical protein AB5J62_43290 [Amycolatopsis sp. cg5]|uniref:hypothetical protein n=1 Tax=Amycolatopsis sp. cg5 TaxID=3238802 RepID=UPI00352533BE